MRFWAKVDRRGPDECWFWKGAVTSRGYGHLRRGRSEDGHVLAHRAAYEIQTGKRLRLGQTIDHTCVQPLCVNAAHLEACSLAENCVRRDTRRQAAQQTAPAASGDDFDLGEYQEAA